MTIIWLSTTWWIFVKVCVLQVPGLMENRPSVLKGDHLFVAHSSDVGADTTRHCEYKGYVHEVHASQVCLGFSDQYAVLCSYCAAMNTMQYWRWFSLRLSLSTDTIKCHTLPMLHSAHLVTDGTPSSFPSNTQHQSYSDCHANRQTGICRAFHNVLGDVTTRYLVIN